MTRSSSVSSKSSISVSEPSRRTTSTWRKCSQVGRFRSTPASRRYVIKGEVFVLPGSIYGFNVEASKSVQQLAAKHSVPLHLHAIIYKLIDELKDELSSKLPPLTSENILGKFSACTFSPERLVPPREPWCHHLWWSR